MKLENFIASERQSVEEETRKEAEEKILREYLMPANDLLRSAYQVTTRKGCDTNWETFGKIIKIELDNQHAVLKPLRISKLKDNH